MRLIFSQVFLLIVFTALGGKEVAYYGLGKPRARKDTFDKVNLQGVLDDALVGGVTDGNGWLGAR